MKQLHAVARRFLPERVRASLPVRITSRADRRPAGPSAPAGRREEDHAGCGTSRAVWIPAGIWHQHRVHGRSSVHTLGFAAHDILLRSEAPVVVAVDALVRELIIACSEPALPEQEARRLRAVLRDRLRRALVEPLTLPNPNNSPLRQACALVTDDLRQPRTVAWLARRIGVSERTLARLFRTEFGMTYPQWRTDIRVFHAMVLLAEGASVSETGRQCGWATTSAFIDTFSRTMGRTPGTYRIGPGG